MLGGVAAKGMESEAFFRPVAEEEAERSGCREFCAAEGSHEAVSMARGGL